MQEFWTKEYGRETGLGRGEKNHPKADIDFLKKIQETSNGKKGLDPWRIVDVQKIDPVGHNDCVNM
jgi:hypothetical protein